MLIIKSQKESNYKKGRRSEEGMSSVGGTQRSRGRGKGSSFFFFNKNCGGVHICTTLSTYFYDGHGRGHEPTNMEESVLRCACNMIGLATTRVRRMGFKTRSCSG
jgi:hypothetical protein